MSESNTTVVHAQQWTSPYFAQWHLRLAIKAPLDWQAAPNHEQDDDEDEEGARRDLGELHIQQSQLKQISITSSGTPMSPILFII